MIFQIHVNCKRNQKTNENDIKIENKEVMVVHILHVLNNYKYKTCQVKQLPQNAKIKLRIYLALHNSHEASFYCYGDGE